MTELSQDTDKLHKNAFINNNHVWMSCDIGKIAASMMSDVALLFASRGKIATFFILHITLTVT